MIDGFEESYCCECGCPSDGEICERCQSETIDWNKQDRRWNGKPFWQESTQPVDYTIPEPVITKKPRKNRKTLQDS